MLFKNINTSKNSLKTFIKRSYILKIINSNNSLKTFIKISFVIEVKKNYLRDALKDHLSFKNINNSKNSFKTFIKTSYVIEEN